MILLISVALLINCGKPDKPRDDGKNSESKTEVRYAVSRDGLRIRDRAETSGSIIGLIPEGGKVDLLEETGNVITISGTTGRWSKVKWNNLNGWVFGGFLSKDQKTAGGPDMPENMIGGYEFTGDLEPGNMPSRVYIEKKVITKAIGGYVLSGSYCFVAVIEKQPDGYSIKCADRNPEADEYEKFQLEKSATKLKQVSIKTAGGKIIIDNEPYKKR